MGVYRSKGGVDVYSNRENIIIEPNHPILIWKANKDKLRPDWFPLDVQKKFPGGLPKLGSIHSEDALTWNIFRTLQINNKLQSLTDIFAPELDIYKIWFWGHDANLQSENIDPEIQGLLDQMEPWGKDSVKQQTETDVILLGKHQLIMVECKLGKPGQEIKAWQRSSKGMRPEYAIFMEEQGFKLFANSFNYARDGNRFYQLFRNYVLGAALASKWKIHFSLLAIVNALNSNLEMRSHQEELNSFRSVLVDPSNTFLITWQQIWNALSKEENLLPLRNCMMNDTLLYPSQYKAPS